MSEVIKYPLGTIVWSKTLDKLWWPGRVVNLEDTPVEFQDYVKNKRKNYKAIVRYDTDNTHDAIMNLNKLMEYNCPNKIDFLTKGYLLYDREIKSGIKKSGICMVNFIKDVKLAEKATGGSENVFENIIKHVEEEAENELKIKLLQKTLFSTPKEMKKKNSAKRSTGSATPEGPRYEILSRKSRTYTSNGMIFCHGRCGKNKCLEGFSSANLVKLHIKEINDKKLNKTISPRNKQSQSVIKTKKTSRSSTQTQSQSQNTQNSVKKKKTDSKKVQEEILNDWCDDDDDNDQDETLEYSEPMVVETSDASASNTIFDFDDNEDNQSASIENLRHVKTTDSILLNSEVNSENQSVSNDNNVDVIVEKTNTAIDHLNQTATPKDIHETEKEPVDDSSDFPLPDIFKATKKSWETVDPGFNKAMSSSRATIDLKDLDLTVSTEIDGLELTPLRDLFLDIKDATHQNITEATDQFERVKILVHNVEHKCLSDEELLKHPLYLEALNRIEQGRMENLVVIRLNDENII